MKLITKTETLDLSELGYFVKTQSYDLPAYDKSSYKVIGRDGEVEFTNGLKNKAMRILLTHTGNSNLERRRYLFSKIKPALIEGGYIVFDYEPQIKWRAKLLDGAQVKFSTSYDVIEIPLTISPYGVNFYDEENITFEEADILWDLCDIPFEGSQNTFIANNETIVVANLGNVPSKPTIKITGTGNISLTANGETISITGLDGAIFIDCDTMIAYDDLKENKMTLTNAKFIELLPGDNSIVVSGEATIQFIDKSRWV